MRIIKVSNMVHLFEEILLGLASFLSLWGSVYLDVQKNVPTNLPDNIQATTSAKVVSVIDGDTIEVALEGAANNDTVRVRYIGIDTPEPYATKVPECGAEEASKRNRELVAGKTVTLIPGLDTLDPYDRLLAYVYVDEVFVNKELLKEGFATVAMFSPNTTYKVEFTNLYKNALAEKLGIWSICPER